MGLKAFVNRKQCGVLVVLACLGCASQAKHSARVELEHDAKVKIGDANPIDKKKGDTVEVSQVPVLVEAPGKIGVLLIPLHSQEQVAKIALQKGGEISTGLSEADAIKAQNYLLTKANEVQTWLAERKTKEALTLVDELIQKYPKVVQLKFMKASCLVLMDERERARVLLEIALKEDPENRAGKDLMQFLTPGSAEKKGGN